MCPQIQGKLAWEALWAELTGCRQHISQASPEEGMTGYIVPWYLTMQPPKPSKSTQEHPGSRLGAAFRARRGGEEPCEQGHHLPPTRRTTEFDGFFWVAFKELNFKYYIGETLY